jgi:hypothetical protein
MGENGRFNCNLADLCVKVCCNVLGIPIVVITSYPGAPHFTFIPDKTKYSSPIYIAFNHTNPGHYDGTKGILQIIIIIFHCFNKKNLANFVTCLCSIYTLIYACLCLHLKCMYVLCVCGNLSNLHTACVADGGNYSKLLHQLIQTAAESW